MLYIFANLFNLIATFSICSSAFNSIMIGCFDQSRWKISGLTKICSWNRWSLFIDLSDNGAYIHFWCYSKTQQVSFLNISCNMEPEIISIKFHTVTSISIGLSCTLNVSFTHKWLWNIMHYFFEKYWYIQLHRSFKF